MTGEDTVPSGPPIRGMQNLFVDVCGAGGCHAMKIKVIQRSLDDVLPAQIGAPAPKKRNLDPALHPFARPREYQRALNAAKLNRMFAKPFVDSLEGHVDGIYCMASDPNTLGCVASGSGDGEVRVWSLPVRSSIVRLKNAHSGMVTSMCFTNETHQASRPPAKKRRLTSTMIDVADYDYEEPEALPSRHRLLTAGVDRTIKLWATSGPESEAGMPIQTYMGRNGFNSISHHRSEASFVAASDVVHVYDENKSEPVLEMAFSRSGAPVPHSKRDNTSGEHLTCVRFNMSETSVLASASSDRTVCLYDLRSGKATSRVEMRMRVNQLSFNPLQPTVMLFASEDHNLYTFDMRYLTSATHVYRGHVGPVMSCDWSPSGRDFVSGSYDRSVRLWTSDHGNSRDIYHTARMQRVFSALYTRDARFVLSGSDDGNLRMWKARASEKLGVESPRERESREMRSTLRKKWAGVGDIGRIERQRHIPKPIHSAQRTERDMREAQRKREENRQAHAPRNLEQKKPKAERKKGIYRVDE